MPCRPVRQRVLIDDTAAANESKPLPTISTVPDLADHPLGTYLDDLVLISIDFMLPRPLGFGITTIL